MKTVSITQAVVLILLAAYAFNAMAEQQQTKSGMVTFIDRQLDIKVEIAASQEQRELGLMHRTRLDENQGMLFVYPDAALREVWMKNTLLALDVLFLNGDGRIVFMLDNLQPCPQDPCPIFNSHEAAMYMLELNADFIENNALKIGQKLRLP